MRAYETCEYIVVAPALLLNYLEKSDVCSLVSFDVLTRCEMKPKNETVKKKKNATRDSRKEQKESRAWEEDDGSRTLSTSSRKPIALSGCF